MDMTGERRIPAAREKVFAALNDPDVLKSCIPGCETMEKTSDTDMKATASVKIGPIAAKFAGKIKLSDIVVPEGYRISGEGTGGVAGFAKGGADVRLADDAGTTVLTYTVQAQVGGKIAQLGARLIDATAKSMADQFFDRFVNILSKGEVVTPPVGTLETGPAGTGASGTGETRPVAPPPPPPPVSISVLNLIPAEPLGFPLVAWIGGGLFLIVMVLIFGAYL